MFGSLSPWTQTLGKTLKPCASLPTFRTRETQLLSCLEAEKEREKLRFMTENPKHLLDSASESSQRPSKIAKTAVEELSDDEEEQQQQQQPPAKEPMSPNSRIQRYLVAIEYIGTRFSGSQKQPNIRTVVGVLEVLPEILVFLKYFLFVSKVAFFLV